MATNIERAFKQAINIGTKLTINFLKYFRKSVDRVKQKIYNWNVERRCKMILKYNVPTKFRHLFGNEKIIYCEVVRQQELLDGIILYKVKMINNNYFSNIFTSKDLKQLNLWDKIKLKLKFKI